MPTFSICPSCNTGYDLADEMRGKRVICKTCNDSFLVQETLRAPAAVAVPVAVPEASPPNGPPPDPTQRFDVSPTDYPEVLPAPPRAAGADPHAPSPSEWDRLPRRRPGQRPQQEGGLSTGAIVAMVLVPVALLIVLAVVLVIALRPRDEFADWRDDQAPRRVRPGVVPIIIPPARFNNPPPQWNPPRVNPPRINPPPRFNPPRVRFR